jgi:branched-chain amino acid transport system substrate-binding protein
MGSRRARRRKLTTFGLVIALVMGVGGLTASASSPRAASPKGTTLLIGWVGSQTSAATGSALSTYTPDTLDAWTKWTNANGGIAGHPVKIVYEPDDKGDPAVAIAAVKDLVENKKVIAIVGPTSVGEPSWADYALQNRIPVIGPGDADALPFTNPMFYSVAATVLTDLWGAMKAAKTQGVKKVGVLLCTEVAACAQARQAYKAAAVANGLDPVYDAVASRTQPSYTAECLAAKNAGVQGFAAYVNNVVLSRDCVRQGFHALWIQSPPQPIDQIKEVQAMGNTVGASYVWLCAAPLQGDTKTFGVAMHKYHPEYDKGTAKYNQNGPGDCKAWAAGMVFAKAIENANVAPTATATRDDVIRGLSMFKDETLGGYVPKISYSDGTKANPQHLCIYIYKWKGLTLIPVPSGADPYTCMPAAS